MKMITEKQKKFINDIKGVITENGINAIDAFDDSAVSVPSVAV